MIVTKRRRLGSFPTLPGNISTLHINTGGGMITPLGLTGGSGSSGPTPALPPSPGPQTIAPGLTTSSGQTAQQVAQQTAQQTQAQQGQSTIQQVVSNATTSAWNYAVNPVRKIRPWVWITLASILGVGSALVVHRTLKRRRAVAV